MRDESEITALILFIKEDITLRTQELILLLNHLVMDMLIETPPLGSRNVCNNGQWVVRRWYSQVFAWLETLNKWFEWTSELCMLKFKC